MERSAGRSGRKSFHWCSKYESACKTLPYQRKRENNHTVHYGFVSTGNLNEKTVESIWRSLPAYIIDRNIMADVNRMFTYLENPKNIQPLKNCKQITCKPCCNAQATSFLIDKEIKSANEGKHASITLKLNSLSDEELILKLI